MNRIIYHSKDYDGKTSACLCVAGLDGRGYTLHPYDYGDPIPDVMEWSPSDIIYMLDVSFPLPNMLGIWTAFRDRFIWIDHHESSIKDCETLPIKGIRRVGVSAARLVWEYFWGTLPVPGALELISKYDVWDKSDGRWNTHTLPYQYGLNLSAYAPDPLTPTGLRAGSPEWLDDQTEIARMMLLGGTALMALRSHFDLEASRYSYVKVIRGYRALCLNAPNISSLRLEGAFDPEQHDLMLVWCWTPQGIKVSAYSTKPEVNCADLAKSYGGGGHHGAAGFILKPSQIGELTLPQNE